MKRVDKKTLRLSQLKMLDILLVIDKICRKNNITYWLECGTLLGAVRHQGFIPWDDDIDIAMPRNDFNRFNEIAKNQLGDGLFLQNTDTDKFYFKKNFPCKIRLNDTFFEEEEYCLLSEKEKKSHFGIFVDVFPVDRYSKKYFFRLSQRLLSLIIYAKTISVYKRHNSLSKLIFSNISKIIPWWLIERFKSFQIKNFGGDLFGFGIEMPFTMGFLKHDMIFPLKELNFEGKRFFVPNDYHAVLEVRYGKSYMELPPPESRVWHAVRIKV